MELGFVDINRHKIDIKSTYCCHTVTIIAIHIARARTTKTTNVQVIEISYKYSPQLLF